MVQHLIVLYYAEYVLRLESFVGWIHKWNTTCGERYILGRSLCVNYIRPVAFKGRDAKSDDKTSSFKYIPPTTLLHSRPR